MKKTSLLASMALMVAASSAWAEVKLPAIFGSDMVLQRSEKTAVFGKADPGEAVSVEVRAVDPTPGGETKVVRGETKAGPDGRWRLNLDLTKVPEAPATVVVRGSNELTLTNVLVGDVWVCGGQSNMQWTVRQSANPEAEIAAAKFPMLRLFTVRQRVGREAVEDVEGKWVVCSPETVGTFSAVGYFFGRDLWQARKVPMGLISSNWGGTPADAWTSLETLKADPEWFGKSIERREQAKAADARTAATQPVTRPVFNQNSAGTLFEGMIRPLFPTTVKGTIWYQGESNAGRAVQYVPLLKAMVQDWRRGFENPEMPFLIVQLANYRAVKQQPGDDAWAELREAQAKVARAVGNGGLAVAFDIGEEKDIHPKNKQDVGKRLALQARKIVYGEKDLVAAGPEYKGLVIAGDKAALTFDSVGGGLEVKGEKLVGFQIAGEDRKWVWADAKVEGDKVIVWSEQVKAPVAVRYAWANNLPANLFNKDGLPAAPFRTDDWPLSTAAAR